LRLVAHTRLPLSAALEREAVDAITPIVADLLAPLVAPGAARERVGLFVASTNAGAPTSLRFWAEAQRTGLALASPELFPWCLGNAACRALSRELGITGPNFTFLGDATALADAVEAADDLLHAGRIDHGLVVMLNFANSAQDQAHGLALVAAQGDESVRTVLQALPASWP
jgi:3-oxoacyl-(acyl-carrier-protein) synthase